MINVKNIGINIRHLRERKGWSAERLAQRTFELGRSVSASHIYLIERGGSENITLNTLSSLADALGVSLSALTINETGAHL